MRRHSAQKRPQHRPHQSNVAESGALKELCSQDFETAGGDDHAMTLFEVKVQAREAVTQKYGRILRKQPLRVKPCQGS
jgi:hypothetical protein